MIQLWGYTQAEQAAPGKYVKYATVCVECGKMVLGMRDEDGRHVALPLTEEARLSLIKALSDGL